jgi:Rrf2 family protein
MKLNEGIEWAIHCCTILAALPAEQALPAKRLAEFFDLPTHYLAKHLQSLSQAGLIHSRKGPGGGYQLAKPAPEISVLEIVQAIDGRAPHFQCTEIRQQGPSGVDATCYSKPCGIARTMWAAEKAWRHELAKVSLADIQQMGFEEVPPEQIDKSLDWFGKILK